MLNVHFLKMPAKQGVTFQYTKSGCLVVLNYDFAFILQTGIIHPWLEQANPVVRV